jgi:hypothetical protein
VTNALTQIRRAFFAVDDAFGSSARATLAEPLGRDIHLEFASAPRDDISRLDLAMFNRRHDPERRCARRSIVAMPVARTMRSGWGPSSREP